MTPKQEELLSNYLILDNYMFLKFDVAKKVIDMILKMQHTPIKYQGCSTPIGVNEIILPFQRTMFEPESKEFKTVLNIARSPKNVKSICEISPMIKNRDEVPKFYEITTKFDRAIVRDDGKIMKSYFDILIQNGIFSTMQIIHLLAGELSYQFAKQEIQIPVVLEDEIETPEDKLEEPITEEDVEEEVRKMRLGASHGHTSDIDMVISKDEIERFKDDEERIRDIFDSWDDYREVE